MNGQPDISALCTDTALLLAACEQLCPSMNGAAARRLTNCVLDICVFGQIAEPIDQKWLDDALAAIATRNRYQYWLATLETMRANGVDVVSSTAASYPRNLSLIHDQPPLLFIRGSILPSDQRSVAIVGTRNASDRGIRAAARLAKELAAKRVTIVSGLAKGIDSAAHQAALDAGGRTIAVYGTSITRVYPAQNKALAAAIEGSGACVSQFLPTSTTGPWAFPVRNITTSGLSLGTVVVEAGETSGARLQAEAALAHGKRVFLLNQLVTHQPWAQEMATKPNVTVANTTDDVLTAIESALALPVGVLL